MELTELCDELRNWFEVKKTFGKFTVSDGKISLPDLKSGQYFRIVGSVFNDGVHKYPSYDLTDEIFEGAIWAMAVPPAVVALLDEINVWESEYGNDAKSPYTSESFGGYSYTKKTGGSNTNGSSDSYTYKNEFSSKLNRWRKV